MSTEINLFSRFTSKTAKARFKEALEKCIWLKASTAYWTIKPDYFGDDLLVDVLKRKDSFFCVHFEYPTNWRQLEKMVNEDANIFLHYHKLPATNALNLRIPLLHAKVNLFALPDEKAEIWVGSYNMTNKALSDTNIESVTIITTTQTSSIYQQTLDFLNNVRAKCQDFDKRRMLAYEFNRKQNLLEWGKENIANLFKLPIEEIGNYIDKSFVIRLTGYGLSNLAKTAPVLQIICMDEYYRKVLNKLGDIIIIEAWDANTKKRYLYKARIQLASVISKNIEETYDIRFSTRRYAVIRYRKIGGVLEAETPIDENHLKKAALTATLIIERPIHTLNIYTTPKIWKQTEYTEHLTLKSTDKKEQAQLVDELILDIKTLDHPETIPSIPRKGVDALLAYYRNGIGLSIKAEQINEEYYYNVYRDFESLIEDHRALEKRLVIGKE